MKNKHLIFGLLIISVYYVSGVSVFADNELVTKYLWPENILKYFSTSSLLRWRERKDLTASFSLDDISLIFPISLISAKSCIRARRMGSLIKTRIKIKPLITDTS